MPVTSRSHRTVATASVVLAAALSTTVAAAGWPTTPDESIRVGTAQGTFLGLRQSLTVNDAGIWITWQELFCGGFDEGFVRLNRLSRDGEILTPGGIAAHADPTCGFTSPPLIAAIPSPANDTVATVRGLGDLSQEPLNAFAGDAQPAWTPGFTTATPSSVQSLGVLPGGDLVTASINSSTIRLDRIAPDGTPIASLDYQNPAGANLTIRAIIPTGSSAQDAAFYLVWDAPLTYTRRAFVQRFDADLNPLWDEPITPMPLSPFTSISRHTPPAMTLTSEGRLLYVWTHGFETGTTPAPIRYQIINPDGSLVLPVEGARLTDSDERQFDPIVLRDDTTGEISVVYRAGLFDEQSVRAQRLSAGGARVFDDAGVEVTTIPVNASFNAAMLNGELHTFTIAKEPTKASLNAHQLTDTQAVRGPWPIARTNGSDAFFSIAATEADLGVIVTWQQEGPELDDALNAAQLNPVGRLGANQCSVADVAAPYYVLDLTDIQTFIPAFVASDPAADLANPSGVLDLADVSAFITAFNQGCF